MCVYVCVFVCVRACMRVCVCGVHVCVHAYLHAWLLPSSCWALKPMRFWSLIPNSQYNVGASYCCECLCAVLFQHHVMEVMFLAFNQSHCHTIFRCQVLYLTRRLEFFSAMLMTLMMLTTLMMLMTLMILTLPASYCELHVGITHTIIISTYSLRCCYVLKFGLQTYWLYNW